MIDSFQTADFVLCGITLVMAVLGLFRGFSGTLAFVLAVGAATFVAAFGWAYSASLTTVLWQRGAGTLVATLLAFGLVRLVVKKLVNGLLSQPSDAIFGGFVGLASGVALVLAWAHSGAYLEYSVLAKLVASWMG